MIRLNIGRSGLKLGCLGMLDLERHFLGRNRVVWAVVRAGRPGDMILSNHKEKVNYTCKRSIVLYVICLWCLFQPTDSNSFSAFGDPTDVSYRPKLSKFLSIAQRVCLIASSHRMKVKLFITCYRACTSCSIIGNVFGSTFETIVRSSGLDWHPSFAKPLVDCPEHRLLQCFLLFFFHFNKLSCNRIVIAS